MLTKIWTMAIVLSAAASLVAWVCVAAHARGIRPLRAIARFAQKLSLAGVVVFGLMAAPLYRAGSTKVGGGTNNVPPNLNHPLPHMQQGDILSQTGLTGLPFPVPHSPFPIANPVQDPITSTNTTRTLTAEDFERGFVMARVGTGEEVDFSAPSNAVVCADWYSFGAAKDWIYVAMTNWMFKVGTNNVECLRVYSFGKIVPLVRETNGSISTNAVFDRGVSAMFSPTMSDYDIADILAFHIPAVSSPAGKVPIRDEGQKKDFDINSPDYRANDWGREGVPVEDEQGIQHIEKHWLHSDVKNMAYYYVYPAFTNIIERGAMK